ncbi:zf-HC2 domain-containing protein [Kitasatospora terrestris]|uniref:Putative zinc-finger domain-containing protein n=1 Tax=Kitasatospora terrestris TaxID=258051 RepID=A0ABP9DRP2_9ACTN
MTPHPPSPGPHDHPDLDLIADLAEGLLPAASADELRAHLAGCPECADTSAALAEVSELLGGVEAPSLPDTVAARIDAALAAESAARSAVTPGAPRLPAPAGPHGAPGGAQGAPPPRPARPPAATGPGRTGRPRRRRTAALLLGTATALAGVLTLGGLLLARQDTTAGTAASDTGAHEPAVAGRPSAGGNGDGATKGLPEYRADNLPDRVRELLAAHGSSPRLGTESSGSGAGTVTAPGCVTAATGHPTDTPLATASGRYAGQTVTVLLFPAADRADRLDVYLVTPDCPGATVLLRDTVPAP